MKHMNSRRILAMLLALCMMVGMLSMTAFAGEVDAETTGSENSSEETTGPVTTGEQLVAAFANANDGGTITLGANVELTTPITVTKSITLDLGEFTAKFTGASIISAQHAFEVSNAAAFIIKGTTGKVISDYGVVTLYSDGCAFELQGGTLVSSRGYTVENFSIGAGKTITISGGAIEANCTNGGGALHAGSLKNGGLKLIVTGGKITASNGYAAIYAGEDTEVSISNVEINTTGMSNSVLFATNTAKATLENVTVVSDKKILNASDGASIAVKSGSYTNTSTSIFEFNTENTVAADDKSTISISGGTFVNNGKALSVDAKYLDSGCTIDETTGEVTKEVIYVAYIGDQGYTTLEEAIGAVQDGGTVEIAVSDTYSREALNKLSNQSKNVTIKAREGVVAVIDMPDAVTMSNSGTTTFENITFQYTTANYRGLQHAGNVVYNNCKINGVVFLYGTSEIFNGCVFTQTESGNAYNVWVYGTPHAEFNDCTFNNAGKTIHVYNENKGTDPQLAATDVTLKSCTVKSTQKSGNKSVVNIKTDKVPTELKLAGENKVYYNETDITDATGLYVFSLYQGTEKPDSVKDSNVYQVTENEDGTTTETKIATTAKATGVAKITRDGTDVGTYATLEEAFAAAADGDTVKLTANIDLSTTVIVKDKTVTLDLNGFKLFNTAEIWNDTDGVKHWSLISVRGTSNLTIVDSTNSTESGLFAKPNDVYALDVYDEASEVTIKAGNFVGNCCAIYAVEGFVTIEGGHYSVQQKHSATQPDEFVLNCYDANYKAGKAKITVKGGSFEGYDPFNNDSEGAGTKVTDDGVGITKTVDESGNVTYNAATGMVAQIVGTDGKSKAAYKSLNEAFEKAEDGDTITLLSDCSGNGIMVEANTFGTGLTIDFNTHTYMFNGKPVGSTGSETQAAHFESGNKITLKNGTFDVDATAGANVVILVQNYADLTLDNMTLDGANVAITMLDRITLSTNNGAVTANNTKIIAPKKQENTTLFTSYAIAICGFQNYEGTSVTVTGENSTITGDIKFSKEAAANDSTYVLHLALNEGTVSGSLSFGKDLAGVTMTVTKGENVTVTPPAGYEWRNNVLVKLADAVAKTGGKSYPTLQEAVDAATDAGTVTLMADITVDESVVINKNLTLEFAHHTITGGTGVEVLNIFSKNDDKIKVKLSGSSGTDGSATGGINGGSGGDNKAVRVGKNAEVTIYFGTYTVGSDAKGEGNSTIFVCDNGVVNIQYGTFSSEKPWSGFYYVLNRQNGCTGTFNVKGGTFINYNPLKGDDNDGGNFCGLLYGIRTEKNEKDGSVSYIAKQGSLQVLDEDGEPVDVYKNSQLEKLRTNLKDGQTVMLLSNTTLSSQMVIDKAITLDLNEKVLTSTYAADSYAIVVKANATIKNGSINAATYGMQANADVTIDRVKLSTTGPMGLVVGNKNTPCNVKIMNTEITAKSHALFDQSDSNTITISKSTLRAGESGINHSGSYYGYNLTVTDSTIIAGTEETSDSNINATGVYISGSTETAKHGMQKATFTNCTIKGGTGVEVKYTDLTLDNCTVVSTYGTPIYVQNGNGAATAGFAVVSTDNATKGATPAPVGTVKITGENGKYTGYVGLGALGRVKEDYPDFTDNTIKVSAGKFDRKLESEYCADGYEPTTEATDGYYTVKPAEGNAQLVRNGATVKYANLDVLLDEALSGDTIQLRENVTLEVGFMLEDGVCLDLNGKVLTVPYIFIAPNSTACLYDSYEITSGAGVGMLRMATKKATLSCNPSGATRFVLPVYVGTEDVSGKTYYCYRFYRAMLSYPSSSSGVTGDADSVTMEFILRFQKTEAYQYIYNEPAQLKIRLDATYFVDETSSKGLYFEFSESYSQQWAARYKDGKPQSEFTFWVKITGLSAFKGNTVYGTPSAMSNYLIASIQGTQLEYQIP